ncbi:MAG TPA: glycosyltransferase [Steroidobacteraceae bacterium]|nr:glycosyltransferase [Steroidobacteraceae bacterium]
MLNSSLAEPTISVVIPALNEARYVAAALASVAAQTWPATRLEAVVVDNGSTDATAEVVQAFCATAPCLEVRLVDHPTRGRAGAKNRGAELARGEYLIFLDADSRMASDLAARVAARGRRGYDAGSIRVVADSRDWLDRGFFEMIEFGKSLFQIRAQMFYCARELFLEAGAFDETLQIAEDREFLVRLQKAGIEVCHLRESEIATSPRRLRTLPFRLSMVTMLVRWALADQGLGRKWNY